MSDEQGQVIYDDGHRAVVRVGGKTAGGAFAQYAIVHGGKTLVQVPFQHDTIPLVGVVGGTNETLASMIVDRLECFQAGDFACEANEIALEHFREGLKALEARTADRTERGVEGEHKA